MTEPNQKPLGKTLWNIGDQLRGAWLLAVVKESLTARNAGQRLRTAENSSVVATGGVEV